jgi:hypothetical protein
LRYDPGVTVRLFFDPERVAQLRQQGINPQRQLTRGTNDVAQARTSLELVEENARLRAEVARLRGDVQRLSEDVTRLRSAGIRPDPKVREPDRRDLDDSAQRFALLELDP